MENVDTAYALGQAGFENGLTLLDNPYGADDPRSDAWDQGWRAVRDYARSSSGEQDV